MAPPADKRLRTGVPVPVVERRLARRVRRRLLVRFGIGEAKHTAFTKNVSEVGLFLNTNTVFRPGTTILVEILFPERAWTLWARVAWAKKVPSQLAHLVECGMGVDFLEPFPEWKSFIHAWIKKNG